MVVNRSERIMKIGYILTVGILLLISLTLLLAITFYFSKGGCGPGTVSCSNSDVCVPQKAMCNGYNDCPDGEDEEFQTCGDFHGSDFILNLNRNHNYTRNVTNLECGVDGVPEGCFCRNLVWVYCKNLSLTAVPNDIHGNVSRLILANNSIANIEVESFVHYKLQLIHLEGNGIETLPPNVFQGQNKLEKLFLLYNKLKELNGSIFSGLPSLFMMYLNYNEISFIDAGTLEDLISLQYLDLTGNRLRLEEDFPRSLSLLELILEGNLISRLVKSVFQHVPNLQFLSLGNNFISEIALETFHPLQNLRELYLSHNSLVTLDSGIFSTLLLVEKLFIGNNPVEFLSKDLFQNLTSLASLDLDNIEIENIDVEMFRSMKNLDFIYFKKYYYCTFASSVPKCAPKTDGLSSFNDLLGRPILRVAVWLVALVTCFGNTYVFWGRFTSRDENRSLSWIVGNLAVADFMMGVYLGVIGLKDMQFRGDYHRVSHEWMTSWLCSIIGALAMLSSEVSVFVLVFMSVERFVLIAVPFGGHKRLTPKAALISLVAIWILGIAISICPMVIWRKSTRFYGTNSMCFPLHLDDPYFAGWQFSAFVFLFINFFGILVLAVVYAGMFVSIWRTRHATSLISGDFEFAVRFFFIVLTNTACWLPIVVLKTLAFFRIYISANVYAWVAVLVVPVNSAVNPLLYTLTTPKYLELMRSSLLGRRFTFKHSKNPITSIDTSCSNASNIRRSAMMDPQESFDEVYSKRLALRQLGGSMDSSTKDCGSDLAAIPHVLTAYEFKGTIDELPCVDISM